MGFLSWLLFLFLAIFVRGFVPRASIRIKSGASGDRLQLQAKLVVGLNKYSHDASVCIVDEKTGAVLFAQAKERISGRKHDGGATGELLRYGLRSIGASVDDVSLVVSNNHHHRVMPFERRIPFASALHYIPRDYDDPMNLVPNARHMELSHHMAHAWSVVGSTPVREGVLVVVMDGMGEQYKAMAEHMGGLEGDDDYMHDLRLLRDTQPENFVGVPTALLPGSSYREAESAYLFDGYSLTPVFKRWTRERSPPELYNHGFENMESLGAVYSRISSQALGDWNSCGKIMGLASWSGRHRTEAKDWIYGPEKLDDVDLGDKFFHGHTFMTGNPYEDGGFVINWDLLESLPQPNQFCMARFGETANLANSVQNNLESSAMQLVASLKASTGAAHLALVGGVALNSVLNGRLLREAGFQSVFVPRRPVMKAWPWDVPVRLSPAEMCSVSKQEDGGDGRGAGGSDGDGGGVSGLCALLGYQGREFGDDIVDDSVFEYLPWATAERFESVEKCTDAAVETLVRGRVAAWYQGRSEFGQRALGHRSFLADPRDPGMRRVLNCYVKQREWWRPLAPSVLAEEAGRWFEGLSDSGNESPFMSITACVKEDLRQKVPSICHIDGSARLQTVTAEQCPLYHSLISKFKAKTGIPMVLNTSFNKKGQPIVESPEQAISTFLACGEAVEALYIGRWKVQARPFPLSTDAAAGAAGAAETQPVGKVAEMSVSAVRFYMSEVTSSPSIDAEPLRVRVQDGRLPEGADPWVEMPSLLHLELLQLLQPQEESTSGNMSYQVAEEVLPDVTVHELWEAIREVRGMDCTWADIRYALNWLYEARLVYFNGPSINIDVDPAQFFRDTDILDLRTD